MGRDTTWERSQETSERAGRIGLRWASHSFKADFCFLFIFYSLIDIFLPFTVNSTKFSSSLSELSCE